MSTPNIVVWLAVAVIGALAWIPVSAAAIVLWKAMTYAIAHLAVGAGVALSRRVSGASATEDWLSAGGWRHTRPPDTNARFNRASVVFVQRTAWEANRDASSFFQLFIGETLRSAVGSRLVKFGLSVLERDSAILDLAHGMREEARFTSAVLQIVGDQNVAKHLQKNTLLYAHDIGSSEIKKIASYHLSKVELDDGTGSSPSTKSTGHSTTFAK